MANGKNIAYVRVSTLEQNEARQREALQPYNIDKWFIQKKHWLHSVGFSRAYRGPVPFFDSFFMILLRENKKGASDFCFHTVTRCSLMSYYVIRFLLVIS